MKAIAGLFALVALVAVTVLCAAGAARAQGFTTFDNPGGGRVIAGTLPAADTSTQAALIDMLRRTHAYFGAKPQVTRLEKSPDGASALADFTSAGRAGSVSGAVMAIASQGTAPFGALVFDVAGHFHQTMPVLLRKAESLRPASPAPTSTSQAATGQAPAAQSAAAGADVPPLTRHNFADGSGNVGLPADWTLKGGQEGTFAAGPANTLWPYALFGVPLFQADQPGSFMARTQLRFHPPGALPPLIVPYDADPARSLVAMLAAATRANPAHLSRGDFILLKMISEKPIGHMLRSTTWTVNFLFRGPKGETYHFFGNVNISPPLQDGVWMMNVDRGFVAPADRFKTLVPTFLAITKSLKLNMKVIRREAAAQAQANARQFQANQATIQANQRAFQANLRANQQTYNQNFQRTEAGILHQQDASHAAARAFIRTIQGTTVVADPATGKHYVAPASVAGALARQDPSHFQIVPLSQYIKGTDY